MNLKTLIVIFITLVSATSYGQQWSAVDLKITSVHGDDLNIENINATILDLSGREIATTTYNAFDVSELPAGIYLVKVNTGEKVLSTKLIVK